MFGLGELKAMKIKKYHEIQKKFIIEHMIGKIRYLTIEQSLYKKKFNFCGIKYCRRTNPKEKYKLQYEILKNSEYFNTSWYLEQNSDVISQGIDPITHYLKYGWKEQRSPSPIFDFVKYQNANPDIQNAGISPLVHYLLYGQKENRILYHQVQTQQVGLINKFSLQNGIVILTTKHCLYIARLLQNALTKIHCPTEIIFKKPQDGYKNIPHIVICPNMFKELPLQYISYQLEQLKSSKWYTEDYKYKLQKSIAIFDYAVDNISFLHHDQFDFRQIYYMPISYNGLNYRSKETKKYDVLFYGDMSSLRRKKILNYLKNKKIKVKIIQEIYDSQLYAELQKAKIIINIHYYDNPLLETTRLCEILSQTDAVIISENTKNTSEYPYLEKIIDFVNIGDYAALASKIQDYLQNKTHFLNKLKDIKAYKKQQINNIFEYYFYRFLLASDNLNFDEFYALAGKYIKFTGNFWCLGLPEAQERHQSFNKDNVYDIEYFPGLRHEIGWIGCGLSYKFMMRKAKELQLPLIKICEDDVEFGKKFNSDINDIETYLRRNKDKWDVFSGLIADVSKKTQFIDIQYYKKFEFLYIDRLVSMVFNIYNSSFFECLENWDSQNVDITNTIDRFMENNCDLRVITTNPFLINQKNYLHSTLWGAQNNVYDQMIENSENILTEKARLFYLKGIYKELSKTK